MKHLLCALLFVSSLFTTTAQAEQKQQIGPWDVHYIAFNATFLTPDIAKNYGIVRSKYNAVVNISVLDKNSLQAQKLGIKGTATNMLGQQQQLAFKEVVEGDAVYYLATMSFRNDEHFNFNIELVQGNQQHQLKFGQVFYVD